MRKYEYEYICLHINVCIHTYVCIHIRIYTYINLYVKKPYQNDACFKIEDGPLCRYVHVLKNADPFALHVHILRINTCCLRACACACVCL